MPNLLEEIENLPVAGPSDPSYLRDSQAIPSLRLRARGQSSLDALAWSAGISFVAYGVRVGLRTNQSNILDECLEYLPLRWKRSSSKTVDRLYSMIREDESSQGGDCNFRLFKNDQQLFCGTDKREFFERFESDVALHVADMTRRRVFVHAGVVGWGGYAILIPGQSFSGKTTLVANLVRAGATYYSDEFAVLDQHGRVHPYAQALQIREKGERRQTKHSVEQLGGVAGRVPLPVALVVLSRYKSGATWRPRHLSPGQGLLGILDNTVSARRSPGPALRALKAVVSQSLAIKGVRGEANQVVDWIATYFHPQEMFRLPSE
jgi:hypothetical protein